MDNQKIAAVLDQAIDVAETALQENSDLQTKLADLQKQLTDKEKVILEKVADASKPVFSEAAMTGGLSTLEQLQIITAETHQKIAAELKKNPDSVFALLKKVANVLTSAPAEGVGIDKEAGSPEDAADPDGWMAMAQGQRVAVKPYRL